MAHGETTSKVAASEFATTSHPGRAQESETLLCPICGGATVYHEANPPSPAYYWCEHCQAGWDASRFELAEAC